MIAMICQLQQIERLQCDHRAVTTYISGKKNQTKHKMFQPAPNRGTEHRIK